MTMRGKGSTSAAIARTTKGTTHERVVHYRKKIKRRTAGIG